MNLIDSLFGLGFGVGFVAGALLVTMGVNRILQRERYLMQMEIEELRQQQANGNYKTCENCLATWPSVHIREDDFGVAWCQDCWPDGFDGEALVEGEATQ